MQAHDFIILGIVLFILAIILKDRVTEEYFKRKELDFLYSRQDEIWKIIFRHHRWINEAHEYLHNKDESFNPHLPTLNKQDKDD